MPGRSRREEQRRVSPLRILTATPLISASHGRTIFVLSSTRGNAATAQARRMSQSATRYVTRSLLGSLPRTLALSFFFCLRAIEQLTAWPVKHRLCLNRHCPDCGSTVNESSSPGVAGHRWQVSGTQKIQSFPFPSIGTCTLFASKRANRHSKAGNIPNQDGEKCQTT